MSLNLRSPRQILYLVAGVAYLVLGVVIATKLPIPDVSTTLHYVLGGACFAYGLFRVYRAFNDEM